MRARLMVVHAPQTRIAAAAVALSAAGAMLVRAAPLVAAADVPAGANVAAARTGVSPADRAFMIEAAQAGHALVFASERALSRARDQRVREYAGRMVKQQTLDNAEIRKLARAKGVVLPLEPSGLQRSKLRLLDKAHGAAYDLRYIDDFGIAANQLAIRQFKAELDRGGDADVKALAGQLLPALQQHMQEAQSLRAALGEQA